MAKKKKTGAAAEIANRTTEGEDVGTQQSETATTVGDDQGDTTGQEGSADSDTEGESTTTEVPDYAANVGNEPSYYNENNRNIENAAQDMDTLLNTETLITEVESILTSGTIGGIFGMPYQFLSTVDRRIDGSSAISSEDFEDKMGRKYAEKIASHLPLLFLTPCRPKFMEGFKKSDINSVISGLLGDEGAVSGLEKSGRYYTTEFAYNEYFSCVNLMCAEVAYFLGIQDEEVTIDGKTKKICDINWMQDTRNESFNDYFAAKEAVVLYVDGLTTVSDSFSNTTTDSQLASTVNGFSDVAKELRFVLGNNSALAQIQTYASDTMSKIGSELGNLLHMDSLAGGMLNDLASTGISTVMSGGKLLFPKIWGDSTFSRSYTFDLKLRSPDHDNISIFMNILVPYIHLLALCMPQSVTEGDAAGSPNAYNTPFLVRAYAKGMFNINMGMITDLSVTRGGEAQWNDNGLPTQIDISITVEDLYSTLFMTNPNPNATALYNFSRSGNPLDIVGNFRSFFNIDVVANTEMMDFLANLAGLNIAAEEVGRKNKMIKFLTGNMLARTGANIYNYFDNGISNIIRKMAESL